METTKQFKFRVRSFRTIPDPTGNRRRSRHFAVVPAAALPGDIPMDTNPRKQNLDKKVPRKIRESFLGTDTADLFYLLNRGLLLSAEKVHFNNKTDELTIVMSDFERHGLLDGGHTYRVICENREDADYEQFVTLEVLTGVEEDFAAIVEARNTSMQVSEAALAELRKDTDLIKEMVAGLPFDNNIAYRENEEMDVDVREVVALLSMFNLELWAPDEQPTVCYSGKAATLTRYLHHQASYRRVKPLARKIFELYDHIKRTMPDLYAGHLGKRKEVPAASGKPRTKGWPLYFSATQQQIEEQERSFLIQHDIPTGFTYPILAAMRALVERDEPTDLYYWDCPDAEPVAFYDEYVGQTLVRNTLDASMELGHNPSAVGKNRRHWESLYNLVRLEKMEMKAQAAATENA